MGNDRSSPSDQAKKDLDRTKVQFEYKFNLFMTALIFAILSIAVQHPINHESCSLLKLIEVFSLFLLLLSGNFP